MALDHYPVQWIHTDYSKPAPMDEPVPPTTAQELAVPVSAFTSLKRKVKGTTIRPAATLHPGITAVCFSSGNTASQSFNDGMGGAKQDVHAADDSGDLVINDPGFCFAPGVDDPLVAINALNTGDISSVTFELFCKHDNATPFTTVVWNGANLTKLLKNPVTAGGHLYRSSVKFSDLFGDMDTAATIGGDPDPAFPGRALTVHYSPYQLKVTVAAAGTKTAYPSVAWTYIHVIAHDITLDWFSSRKVSDQKLALFFPPARRGRELALYADLTDKKEDYNLNGQFPATGDIKKIPLESNWFYREERELQDASGYEQWRTHWGDGANVPIQASVLVRNMKGRGVEAPLALGNSWLLWSYKDNAQPLSAEGAGLGPGGHVPNDATIQTFVADSQHYLIAKPADNATPSGSNCHIHRGGKRGLAAVPVLPVQAGTTAANLPAVVNMGTDAQQFPFKVQRCATRSWAVRSQFRPTGEMAGLTGVVFQPSRMAGDAYILQVAIACADLYPQMDVANETVLDASPANLVKVSGTLEVWRQVQFAKYLNGVDALIEYDLVRQKMERNFLWLKILFKKPEKLKMADVQAAYEQVRTTVGGPIENYIKAAMLDPAQMAAALVRDADNEGDYSLKTDASEYFIPFLPWERWKVKMTALHAGNWATAINWSYAYVHAQVDYWRGRDPTLVPIADLWPTQYTRTQTGVGNPAQVTVEIKPDHVLPGMLANIVPNTRTVLLTTGPNGGIQLPGLHLDNAGKLLLDPAWTHVINHLNRFGNDCYHPADNGNNNRDGIPRNTRILIDVSGHTVPQTLYNEIEAYLQEKNLKLEESHMRSQYRTCCGKQWVFALLAELNTILLGPGVSGGWTVVSAPQGVLTNFRHPNGKAMFANAARTGACIPIMNSNDDTLYHEFLHSLFLNHGDQASNDLYKLHQNGKTDSNIMHTGERNAQMDGFLMLRTRGWSFIQTDAAGAVPGGCYAGGVPGALPDPAGSDTTQNAWWNVNCGGAVRTLFGDSNLNRV